MAERIGTSSDVDTERLAERVTALEAELARVKVILERWRLVDAVDEPTG